MKNKNRLLFSGLLAMALFFIVFFCNCPKFAISVHTLYAPKYIGLVLAILALALGLSVADLTIQFVRFFGYVDRRAGLVVRKVWVYALLLGLVAYLVILRVVQTNVCF
jgi:hypothetical protein